jgi:hypothetical protein
MSDLPYALGCPSCRHFEVVSEADPDASLSELASHIFGNHGCYEPALTHQMLAKASELTEAEAAVR